MKLRTLLNFARENKASDIHLLIGVPPMFRIGGDIVPSRAAPITEAIVRAMLEEVLTPKQVQHLDEVWEICVSVNSPESGRARVTVYKRNGRLELAIRMSEPAVRTREQLGLPPIIDDLARRPNGLVVLTGPTGVGKTTTFHYMLDLINAERACKIITIEDPVEFVHSFKRAIVVQQEVLSDTKDFTTALRHVLRQDPDVIGIGEMRDADAIYTALLAAETGHLVIGTLHTPGAVDVVQRMVSAFDAGRQSEIRYILASTLQGVISQNLLPHATSRGRVLACEVLMGTMAVRNQVRENEAHKLYTEMQAGRKFGMITFDQSLLDLYQAGEISYDTALNMCRDPEGFKRRTGGE